MAIRVRAGAARGIGRKGSADCGYAQKVRWSCEICSTRFAGGGVLVDRGSSKTSVASAGRPPTAGSPTPPRQTTPTGPGTSPGPFLFRANRGRKRDVWPWLLHSYASVRRWASRGEARSPAFAGTRCYRPKSVAPSLLASQESGSGAPWCAWEGKGLDGPFEKQETTWEPPVKSTSISLVRGKHQKMRPFSWKFPAISLPHWIC